MVNIKRDVNGQIILIGLLVLIGLPVLLRVFGSYKMSRATFNTIPQQNDPELPIGNISNSSKVDLWIHFQEQAAEIRTQMITVITWGLGLLTALLSYIIVGFMFPEHVKGLKDWEVIFLSTIGITFLLLFYAILWDFVDHIKENYAGSTSLEKDKNGNIRQLQDLVNKKKKEKKHAICLILLGGFLEA